MEPKTATTSAKPDHAKNAINTPLTVVFARHAEAVDQGSTGVRKDDDPPLTALGRRQAVRLARRLDRLAFDHVYVSSALRAHDTALEIMRFHKHTPMTVLKELDEVSRDHFIVVPAGFGPAGRDAIKKERETVERFANRLRHTHKPGEKVLVVGHGNFIRTVMPMLGGRSALKSILLDIGNASVSVLDVWRSGSAVAKLVNCAKHLLPGEST
ncbi:MAG: phosphoglycerate mutase family protein [Verrucomicrobiota bacterium]|nr:phosphoglycerate mutase family protein [Verrucomicrobiota bacterium]